MCVEQGSAGVEAIPLAGLRSRNVDDDNTVNVNVIAITLQQLRPLHQSTFFGSRRSGHKGGTNLADPALLLLSVHSFLPSCLAS